MAKQFLHGADVVAGFEQVGSEGMAQSQINYVWKIPAV